MSKTIKISEENYIKLKTLFIKYEVTTFDELVTKILALVTYKNDD